MPRQITPTNTLMLRVAIALAVLLSVIGTSAARAQESPAIEWRQTSLTGDVRQLYTPASGALFARTDAGLMRSDDAGETWRDVPLPPKSAWASSHNVAQGIVVDPTNHATIYVLDDGLYKTVDDAASWRLLLPSDSQNGRYSTLAISPANPDVLYLFQISDTRHSIRFMRSRDGGETWTEPDQALDPPGRPIGMGCFWSVFLLRPDATDENRLTRGVSCLDRGTRVTVRESLDGGTIWTALYIPEQAQPGWLVGRQADAPNRLILASNRTLPWGNYVVHRSEDGGATWSAMLDYQGGGDPKLGPALAIAGLALDPTRSDRLLLAIHGVDVVSGLSRPAPSPLQVSLDDGQTWAESAPEGLGIVDDVAFGIDGKLMFAATSTGVWRATAP